MEFKAEKINGEIIVKAIIEKKLNGDIIVNIPSFPIINKLKKDMEKSNGIRDIREI